MSKRTPRRGVLSPITLLIIANIALILALMAPGIGAAGQPLLHFLFGWIFAIRRLFAGLDEPLTLLWWLIGALVLAAGLHSFLRSLRRPESPRLQFRSTVAVLGMIGLSLFAGMSLAGTVHQLGWLFTSPEPIFRGARAEMQMQLFGAERLAETLLAESRNHGDWKREWRRPQSFGSAGPSAHDLFATHVVTDERDEIRHLFLWPRNGDTFRASGGFWMTGDLKVHWLRQGDLIAALHKSANSTTSNEGHE